MRQSLKVFAWVVLGLALQAAALLIYAQFGTRWWLGLIPQLGSAFVSYWLYRDVPGPKSLLHNVLALLEQTLPLPSGDLTIFLFIPRRGKLRPKFVHPRAVLPTYHLNVKQPVPEGLEGRAFRDGSLVQEEDMPTTDDGEAFFKFWIKFGIDRKRAASFDPRVVAKYCWPIFPEGNQRPIAVLTIESKKNLEHPNIEAVKAFLDVLRDAFEVEKSLKFKKDLMDAFRAVSRR